MPYCCNAGALGLYRNCRFDSGCGGAVASGAGAAESGRVRRRVGEGCCRSLLSVVPPGVCPHVACMDGREEERFTRCVGEERSATGQPQSQRRQHSVSPLSSSPLPPLCTQVTTVGSLAASHAIRRLIAAAPLTACLSLTRRQSSHGPPGPTSLPHALASSQLLCAPLAHTCMLLSLDDLSCHSRFDRSCSQPQ